MHQIYQIPLIIVKPLIVTLFGWSKLTTPLEKYETLKRHGYLGVAYYGLVVTNKTVSKIGKVATQ